MDFNRRLLLPALVICITILCASATPTLAQDTPVRISIGSETPDMGGSAVRIGDEVYAPVSILDRLSGGYGLSADSRKAIFNNHLGEANSVAIKKVNGANMVPVGKAVGVLGGDMVWDSEKKSVSLLAHVKSVDYADGELRVNCTFPVRYSVRIFGGNKLAVDLDGTKLTTTNKEIAVGSDIVEKCRFAQFKSGTARVVLDLKKNVRYEAQSEPLASKVVLLVGESLGGADTTGTPAPTPIPTPPVTPTPTPIPSPTPTPTPVKPYDVESVMLQEVDESSFDLFIFTSTPASVKAFSDLATGKVGIAFRGGTFTEDAQKMDGKHPTLKDCKFNQEPGLARITMELTRMTLVDTKVEGNSVTVQVRPLYKAGGTLQGKVVVIDPGHMGTNGGAKYGGVLERNINYAIAKQLEEQLRSAGAEVILTRDDKCDVTFQQRAAAAIDNNADFFLSIHCNSNYKPNSRSGMETYFHKTDPSCMALACFVHNAVCATTGICDLDPRSDQTLYQVGLAVLRNLSRSGIPAILLECGYVNHSGDRKNLQNPNHQKSIAQGIVKGLKDYLAGTPMKLKCRLPK